MAVIGVSGKIGSGKTTFCEMLRDEIKYTYNNGFENKGILLNFADKLKKICFELTGHYGYTQEDKNTYLEEWGDTVGGILQTLGTKALRENFDQEVWIKSTLSNLHPNTIYIIGDCRFENEAVAIKKLGGIVVRLNGDPAKVRSQSKRDLSHSSETALDNYGGFDYIYQNDKSIDDLKKFSKNIAEVLINKNQ